MITDWFKWLWIGHGVCSGYDTCVCDSLWHGAACSVADCSSLNPCSRRAIAFYLTLASVILDMTGQRETWKLNRTYTLQFLPRLSTMPQSSKTVPRERQFSKGRLVIPTQTEMGNVCFRSTTAIMWKWHLPSIASPVIFLHRRCWTTKVPLLICSSRRSWLRTMDLHTSQALFSCTSMLSTSTTTARSFTFLKRCGSTFRKIHK